MSEGHTPGPWAWFGNPRSYFYLATVTRDPDNWSRNNIHPEARDTPAAALLAAYLKALEAEASQ